MERTRRLLAQRHLRTFERLRFVISTNDPLFLATDRYNCLPELNGSWCITRILANMAGKGVSSTSLCWPTGCHDLKHLAARHSKCHFSWSVLVCTAGNLKVENLELFFPDPALIGCKKKSLTFPDSALIGCKKKSLTFPDSALIGYKKRPNHEQESLTDHGKEKVL